ncbi:MAG: DUF1287 domain-containing protein [Chthoniobacteraceae bacterium]|nr:DUF1287 domain-containing protein [Chthoniobacteraceae bacterium]
MDCRCSLLTRFAALALWFVPALGHASAWRVDPHKLVEMARGQVGMTVGYDPAYRVLAYPGGDVPRETGVCCDVVVRALRGLSIDLQKEVHEDMDAHFAQYPHLWQLSRPDKNIDHRRVPNLMTLFKRRGCEVPVSQRPEDYLPGDVVTCLVGGTLPHIFIVSDRKTPGGVPLVIHNIGRGAQEEDILFQYKLTGHYRLGKAGEREQAALTSSPAPR